LEIEDFKQLLKEAGFNKKSFAEHINIPHGTINNWGSANKPPVPEWVEKYLQLYIKDKKCQELKDMIKNSGLIN
jgi:DNA-binding transcriptional regulator YiaG